MRDTHRQHSIKRVRIASGFIAAVVMMATCAYGQGHGRRKPRAASSPTNKIVRTITTNPNFTSAESLQVLAHCACNPTRQVIAGLKKLGLLDDTGNFTAKGLEAKKSWVAFGHEENPDVYAIPVGTRKFIRILTNERTRADGTFVVTFEWEFVPNELGTAFGMKSERRTATAEFYAGQTEFATINMVPSITVTKWP
jgi:hypothetical protein